MRVFSQSFQYDDPWSIVALAYFLRYPNPYASHIISCDVIDRTTTTNGTLLTTRLILKRGALPRWFPKGIMQRAESWVIEESEIDSMGKTVRCLTRNLDHVKVMQVHESTFLRSDPDGKTLQTTEARIVSGFGWGLAKKIENHGLNRFKGHLQRSREGISLILSLLRQSRMPQTIGAPGPDISFSPSLSQLQQNYTHFRVIHPTTTSTLTASRSASFDSDLNSDAASVSTNGVDGTSNPSIAGPGPWSRLKTWIYSGTPPR